MYQKKIRPNNYLVKSPYSLDTYRERYLSYSQ